MITPSSSLWMLPPFYKLMLLDRGELITINHGLATSVVWARSPNKSWLGWSWKYTESSWLLWPCSRMYQARTCSNRSTGWTTQRTWCKPEREREREMCTQFIKEDDLFTFQYSSRRIPAPLDGLSASLDGVNLIADPDGMLINNISSQLRKGNRGVSVCYLSEISSSTGIHPLNYSMLKIRK